MMRVMPIRHALWLSKEMVNADCNNAAQRTSFTTAEHESYNAELRPGTRYLCESGKDQVPGRCTSVAKRDTW